MGTQFWWIFDTAAAAILLIAVFLSGRKGFAKTVVIMVGYVLSIVLAMSVSGSASGFIYKNSVRQSNISGIERALDSTDIVQKTKSYIESLGYNVTVSEANVEKIFKDEGDVKQALYKYVNSINGRTVDTEDSFNEKMTEGFAGIMENALSEELTRYAAETAANKVRNNSPDFDETLKKIYGGNIQEAAIYIEENYTGDASSEIIKIFCFIIIIFVFMIIVKIIARKLNDGEAIRPVGDIADHVIGGIFGAAEGLVLIFIVAAAVRSCVILGSNGMLLFNSDTIDKTIFFKHIYNLVLKL